MFSYYESDHILRNTIFERKEKMKFPWSKPSAYEIVEALFNEFTLEERVTC